MIAGSGPKRGNGSEWIGKLDISNKTVMCLNFFAARLENVIAS